MTQDHLKTRGVLREVTPPPFTLTQQAPSAHLADLVELYWFIEWDIPEHEGSPQRVLSHPSLHLVIEPDRAYISGIPSTCYVREVRGRGRVASVKLLPGQSTRLLPRPAHVYTDREVPLSQCFPEAHPGDRLQRAILEEEHGSQAQRDLFEQFLTQHARPIQRANLDARRLIDHVASTKEITRVPQLARVANLSERSLQRLFMDHVGVSPKWIIQRYRLHEAAALLVQDPGRTIASIAQELGYFDQAHFSKEFKNFTGQSPGDYRAP